jgi:membrane protease subunit (stomatin/prohibitin family)
VRLRAFGTFAVKIIEPAVFLKQIVGTNGRFSIEDLGEQLRDMVVSRFADVLGESKIPVLDLASNQDELGKFITARIKDDFASFGLQVPQLWVENISLPPEVEQAMDKRTSMGVIGDLGKYAQFQAATAMEKAAENPGGAAAAGIGMGMGFGMANQMGQMYANQQQASSQPPPMPGSDWFMALDGQQAGPMDRSQLQTHARAGKLTRDTLVWRKGMPQWSKAGEVPEVAELLGSTPPPLPPR